MAAYRSVILTPVLPALEEMPERAKPQWRAWRTRVIRQKEVPEAFAEVLNDIARFTEFILKGADSGQWNGPEQNWEDCNE